MRRFLTVMLVLTLTVGSLLASGNSKKAPDFTLETGKGSAVTLSKLQGKVVLVNFWATWCGPCRAEIPGFLEVYKEYKSKGFEIVGISLDQDGWKKVIPFVERFKIDYPIVMGNLKVVEAYGNFNAIPTSFLVDKKGNIVNEHVGYLSKEDLIKLIKPLL